MATTKATRKKTAGPRRSAGVRKRPARARSVSKVLTPVSVIAPAEMAAAAPPQNRIEQLRDFLFELVSDIPASQETSAATPADRSRALILQASSKAAVISGGLALPPGLIGLLTILPELQLIWRTQAQLVADIAAVYGKSYQLGKQQMIFCLFRHLAGHLVRDVVVRAGERFLVRRASQGVLQQLLQRIRLRVAERATARAVSRLVPIVGAVGIGGYAFFDTRQVGRTAVALFEREIVEEDAARSDA